MAKRSAVNKSQAIRDALSANPDKSPSEIADLLKEQGITISAQYVSTIKSNAKVKTKRRVVARGGRPTRSVGGSSSSGMSTMEAALALIKASGGLEQAKNVLSTIEQISQVVR